MLPVLTQYITKGSAFNRIFDVAVGSIVPGACNYALVQKFCSTLSIHAS